MCLMIVKEKTLLILFYKHISKESFQSLPIHRFFIHAYVKFKNRFGMTTENYTFFLEESK